MRKLALISATAVLLIGCATKVWYKTGAGTADFQVDKANCISEAYSHVPYAPAMYVLPEYASCSGFGNSAECFSSGGGPVSYDANSGMRDEVYSGCMYSKGWSLVTRQEAKSMISEPPAAPQTSLSPTQQRQDMLKAYSDSCVQGLTDACRTLKALEKGQ
jgi:hypothetical protein